jgi:hypothetical protein
MTDIDLDALGYTAVGDDHPTVTELGDAVADTIGERTERAVARMNADLGTPAPAPVLMTCPLCFSAIFPAAVLDHLAWHERLDS